jgi:hypothetical protein
MPRVRQLLVTTLAAVALTASACGGGGSGASGGSGPAGDVLRAVQKTSDAETLTTTIRLDATPASLQALAHAGNATLDASSAAAIKGASVVIETAKHDGKNDADVRVLEGSKALLELRAVNDSLYVQADVRGILTLVHKPQMFANLRAETKSMPSFVQAALNGDWVSIPAAALSSLTQAGGSGSAGAAAKGIKILNELRDVIKRDVTVTAAGSDSRGQHFTLSGNEKVLAGDLQTVFSDSVPGGGALGQRIPSAKATNRTIHLDAWVNGGSLSTLSLDLAQFGDPGTVPSGTTLPLVVSFEQSGSSIDPPSGAVPVDMTQLGTLVGALTGGSSG